MKKLVLVMIAFIVSMSISAKEVTEQEALLKAQKFMQGRQFKQFKPKNLRRAATTTNKAYYIFNAEDNGGFIIVSGDDRMTEILGYSDEGTLNIKNAPDGLKWLLSYYEHVMDSVNLMTPKASSVKSKFSSPSRAAIEPLVKTQWGQDVPYNSLCPQIDGINCQTGCVATAVAQALNYYQWPQGQMAGVEAYTTETSLLNMPALEPTVFDWNNMTDNDVTRLMQYSGQLFKMDYGINASGAYTENLGSIFTEVLGYSKALHSLNRDLEYYDDDLWESAIYDELKARRIVIYDGYSWSAPGHLWLVDGYKDGFFHMNWGWAGNSDGYYKISGIDLDDLISVYDMNHVAYVGVMPPVTTAYDGPKVNVGFSNYNCEVSIKAKGYVSRASTSEEFPAFRVYFDLSTEVAGNYQLGVGLMNENGNFQCLTSDEHTFSTDENYYFDKEVSLNGLTNGNYRLIALCRGSEADAWQPCVGTSYDYLEVVVTDLLITVRRIPDGTHSKLYEEVGVQEIDGVTYFLYDDYDVDNHLAMVLAKQVTGKYAGDVVIPSSVVFEGVTYRVYDEQFAFVNCDELTSLDVAITDVEDVRNCPSLKTLKFQEGVAWCRNIGNLPLVESIEMPSTFFFTYGENFLYDCAALKTIRFNGKMVTFHQNAPRWDDSSLPSLTDIYFPSEVPPTVESGQNVPAHSRAKIHIPTGALAAYKQSVWKDWEFVEDIPADDAVTWGYCNSDAIELLGSGVVSSQNYVEYAMRVPAEEMEIYKGCKITKIQLCSPYAAPNDYHHEDYEYVYITKRGTDYLVKQPFNIVRGRWNTIELETPYTITGEEIFVGFGRFGAIGVSYSDMTDDKKDAAWGRAIGDDYNCIWEPGVWQKLGKRTHPFPLRFVIEGSDVPMGVVPRDLEVTDMQSTSAGAPQRAPGTTPSLQITVRNRSLTPITSYQIQCTIDGLPQESKVIETSIPANSCETITYELPAEATTGNHLVSMDILSMNGVPNELAGKNMPSIELIDGVEGTLITALNYTREYGDPNPSFDYTSLSTLENEPVLICNATIESPVGTYPINIEAQNVDDENLVILPGTLTITKAPLTVTAKSYTIKQGEALPTLEAEYSGWKNGETSAVLTVLPTLATTATSASAPGTYDIVVSGAEATNYSFTYVKGTLTVTEADGILGLSVEHPADVYDLQGNKVRTKATSLQGLPKGVYVIAGRKVVVK